MANKDKDDKGLLSGIVEKILSDPEWLIIGYYAFNAMRTGVVSNDAPDKAKGIAKGLGASTGGKGDPTDEAYYLHYTSKIASGQCKKKRDELRFILRSGIGTVFRLSHKSEREQLRGQADFEDWRQVLVRLGQIDPDFVVRYLTELAESFHSKFGESIEWVEETSSPIPEGLTVEEKNAIQNTLHLKAWQRACDQVATEMHNDSIKVPLFDLEPTAQKLWRQLREKGPILSHARAETSRFLKPWWKLSRIMGRRHRKKGWRKAKKGWEKLETGSNTFIDNRHQAAEARHQKLSAKKDKSWLWRFIN